MPANRKPKAWNLKPQMTAAPELWKGNAFTSPFWDAKGTDSRGQPWISGGTPSLVTDEFGSCISFNGVDEYLEIPDSLNWAKDKFTVAFRSKIATGDDGTDQRAVAAWTGGASTFGFFVVWMDADGLGKGWRSQIKSGSDSGDVIATIGSADASNFILDQWQSIVCVYDLVTYKLYVDGALVGSQAASTQVGTLASNTRVGNMEGVGQFFKGKIDMPVIQSRPWTQDEVRKYHSDPFAMLRPAGF